MLLPHPSRALRPPRPSSFPQGVFSKTSMVCGSNQEHFGNDFAQRLRARLCPVARGERARPKPAEASEPAPTAGSWGISAFLRIAKTLYLVVFTQFRTENRFPLFLELL